MKTLTDIRLLMGRPFMQSLLNPAFIFVNISTPIMYLVLFMPLLKKLAGPGLTSSGITQLFLPGIIALLFATAGIFSAYPTIFELKKGLVERLRVTPASRFGLVVGPIFSSIAWTMISSAVIVALSIPFGFHIHIVGLVLFAVLLALLQLFFASFATWLVISMKGEITSISGILTGLNLPLILLGGIMLPLSLAPHWIRIVAHIDPLYYVVEGGRNLAAGQITTMSVGVSFLIVGALSFLMLWSATRVYRKAVA